MLGIDKTCIRISCGTFLSLIKELNLLRVLEFISGCDGVHASSTNTETVTFTAPYTTLLPKDLAHLPSPTPRGWGTHPSRQGFAGTSYGCPPPPVRPSRAEAVLHFLNELFIFMEAYRQKASLVAQTVKNLPATQETWVRSLGREDPLEKRMATHSSILAWRISWTKEPGGLQSMGWLRVRHD